MWHSIQSILKPESLQEAWKAGSDSHQVFFSGGSYLVVEQDPNIKTLIDLNGLLHKGVSFTPENLRIGAGMTLQDLVEELGNELSAAPLIKAVKFSCPSKNIRHQRTIGGEIAQGRIDSEVLVLLHSLSAELKIFTGQDEQVSIQAWNGKGIITEIICNKLERDVAVLERFAVIPSAPAVLIVAGCRLGDQFQFAVGGKATKIQVLSLPADQWNGGGAVSRLAQEAAPSLQGDHFGSRSYKHKLLEVALRRAGDRL
jgi:CO/xanthine dehydrogenase FAD-binding subunit